MTSLDAVCDVLGPLTSPPWRSILPHHSLIEVGIGFSDRAIALQKLREKHDIDVSVQRLLFDIVTVGDFATLVAEKTGLPLPHVNESIETHVEEDLEVDEDDDDDDDNGSPAMGATKPLSFESIPVASSRFHLCIDEPTETVVGRTPTAILFPGQGAQKVGMGASIVRDHPDTKDIFDYASSVLGYDLLKMCVEGPQEELNATRICQPAVFTCSLAALQRSKREKPEMFESCSVTGGLSLGEYTALVFAGVISFEDGIRLVKLRADSMQEAAEMQLGGMVSLIGKLTTDQMDRIVEKCRISTSDGKSLRLWPANYLSETNVVLAGDLEACDNVVKFAPGMGAQRAIRVQVSGAFHTEMMRPAEDSLRNALECVDFMDPRIPIVCNVSGEVIRNGKELKGMLIRQLTNPVMWDRCLDSALGSPFQCRQFFEVGPGIVLTGLSRRKVQGMGKDVKTFKFLSSGV
eukprot:TRINITY_DN689_c0_g2_i1.p1 TRINITY_DN689_c0_g2~~TRINITY_DN689_c0_g2_i1.p1  ORF type:complete len:462 (+),score=130.40 TRINITY_DN689_c0_g2_i1:189-1574(+)